MSVVMEGAPDLLVAPTVGVVLDPVLVQHSLNRDHAGLHLSQIPVRFQVR